MQFRSVFFLVFVSDIVFHVFVTAKNRGIAIPSDLDVQVATMFEKSQMIKKHTMKWQTQSKKRESITVMSRSGENRNIIEGLQVCVLVVTIAELIVSDCTSSQTS